MDKVDEFKPRRGVKVLHPEDQNPGNWEQFFTLFEDVGRGETIRDHRRKRHVKLSLEGQEYYCKIYTFRHSDRFWDRFRGSGFAWAKSKARQHLENAQRMEKLGLNTVPIEMVIERRYKVIKQEGMIISKSITGKTLKETIVENDYADWKPFVEQCIKDLCRLHQGGFLHGDAHTGNCILGNERIWWCDFGTLSKRAPRKKRKEELENFLKVVLEHHNGSRLSKDELTNLLSIYSDEKISEPVIENIIEMDV